MNRFILWFTKITGAPLGWFYFKKKVYYENKKSQSRKIKGSALIISNHTSVFDYALYMFTFFRRNLRVLIAELMYDKGKLFGWFLKKIGGIKVDRNTYDFNFMGEMIDILDKGGVGLIFPEARIPTEKDSEIPLPFKPSFVYMALETNTPIIPVYTNGKYGKFKERAKIVIGEKIYLREILGDKELNKENIDFLCQYVRNKIISLGEMLDGKEKEANKTKKNAD